VADLVNAAIIGVVGLRASGDTRPVTAVEALHSFSTSDGIAPV
jgi:hypothetical protein